MEFKHTVLPEFVAPATSKCGNLAKSDRHALPATSCPSAIVKLDFLSLKTGDSKTCLKGTIAILLFGTSTPTKDFPGIGASILIGCAAKAKARSLLKPSILDNLTPSAGRKVYCVTVGPMAMPTISTSMPKLANVFLIFSWQKAMSPAVGLPALLLNNSKGKIILGYFFLALPRATASSASWPSLSDIIA